MTMKAQLSNFRVALVIANGFIDREFREISEKLDKLGIIPDIISPEEEDIKSSDYLTSEIVPGTTGGILLRVHTPMFNTNSNQFDMIIIPGGAFEVYKLTSDAAVLEWLKRGIELNKMMCFSSQAIEVLLETNSVEGRFVTSPVKYKSQVLKAGGYWVNDSAVSDKNIITGKNTASVGDFATKIEDHILRVQLLANFSKKADNLKNRVQ